MTAISAPSASESHEAAKPFPELHHVRIPGNDRTFQVRDVLRGMGLRWDRLSHAWHGSLSDARRNLLSLQYGLKPQIVRPIEEYSESLASAVLQEPRAAAATPRPVGRPHYLPNGLQTNASGSSHPRPSGPGTRTRAGARVAFPRPDEDDDGLDSGRFSLLEITSGLPDDSREADERAAERHLRELRARVKAARALVATTPGLADTLRSDPRKALRFYARLNVSDEQFHKGVPPSSAPDELDAVK